MARTFHYLEAPGEVSAPLQWFRDLPDPPVEVARPNELLLWFDKLGSPIHSADGRVDGTLSPLVALAQPTIRRGVLWTAGQVQFLTKRRSVSGNSMAKIQREFEKWLSSNPIVAGHSISGRPEFEYYLEGANWGFADAVFALPSGMEALESGHFFVNIEDNDIVLDKVCKTLKLRGVSCC